METKLFREKHPECMKEETFTHSVEIAARAEEIMDEILRRDQEAHPRVRTAYIHNADFVRDPKLQELTKGKLFESECAGQWLKFKWRDDTREDYVRLVRKIPHLLPKMATMESSEELLKNLQEWQP